MISEDSNANLQRLSRQERQLIRLESRGWLLRHASESAASKNACSYFPGKGHAFLHAFSGIRGPDRLQYKYIPYGENQPCPAPISHASDMTYLFGVPL